jgi:DNA-binding transcriptional LysR family regulator
VIDAAAFSWDDIRAFLEIARCGSLPDAARALQVSHATAGRRLQRLEAALGARLFDRLPNRLVLTPLGEELTLAAGAMRQGAAAVAQRARVWTAPPGTPVRVTATGSVSLFLAAGARQLADMAASQGASMSILTTKATLDLANDEAEIALRMRRLPEAGPLAARRLGRLAFAVYAARSVWGQRPPAASWNGIGLIGLPETARVPSQSRWLDAAGEAHDAVVRLRLDDVSLRHRAVRDGAGASLLPCFLGDADPDLIRVLGPPPELVEDVYLMLHERTRRVQPVRDVADEIARLFKNAEADLDGTRVMVSP